ncbi:hypothetical protein CIB84_016692 [Bambusicola thoracicus]|uniref:Uncharacterized protein n=1 Tax=Bambusicola thoracicus TaxID=9083 RepID=A0A2P4S613_BAMTH|nr:hypothetical protein CIB84_016692 [Bambusicola thoracicus]
MMLKTTCLK